MKPSYQSEISVEMEQTNFQAQRLYDWGALAVFLDQWNVSLSEEKKKQNESYLNLVAYHDLEAGLTADISPQNLLLRHASDALACLPILKRIQNNIASDQILRVADLGSGAGFIGIVIKIAFPEINMTLIEPLKRRFDFLNLALIALGLKEIHLIKKPIRASQEPFLFDIVIERAVAPLEKAAKIAEPLLRPKGFFIAYQSQNSGDRPISANNAAPALPLEIKEKLNYRLPVDDKNRYLIICQRGD